MLDLEHYGLKRCSVGPEWPASHGVQAVVLAWNPCSFDLRHYGLKRRSVGGRRPASHGVQAKVLALNRSAFICGPTPLNAAAWDQSVYDLTTGKLLALADPFSP